MRRSARTVLVGCLAAALVLGAASAAQAAQDGNYSAGSTYNPFYSVSPASYKTFQHGNAMVHLGQVTWGAGFSLTTYRGTGQASQLLTGWAARMFVNCSHGLYDYYYGDSSSAGTAYVVNVSLWETLGGIHQKVAQAEPSSGVENFVDCPELNGQDNAYITFYITDTGLLDAAQTTERLADGSLDHFNYEWHTDLIGQYTQKFKTSIGVTNAPDLCIEYFKVSRKQPDSYYYSVCKRLFPV